MSRLLLVNYAPYHRSSVKPRSFAEFCEMYETHGRLSGLWAVESRDARSGEVLRELWTPNVVTDNGATALLKNLWNNAGSAVAIMNQIAITRNNQGCATLTSALTAGQTAVTSLAVSALPAAIPSGASVTVSYGTPNAETFVLSAAAAAGATSLSVTSQTSVNAHAVNDNVVPVPTVADNPSSLANAAYSGALSAGAFTFSGAGAGNRQVSIQYTFTTATTAGNYTEAWTANANPVVAGATASHIIFPPATINATTQQTITIVEKL